MKSKINYAGPLWQYNSTRVYTAMQLKWRKVCKSSSSLEWMEGFDNPHDDDKPPPAPWTERQLISLAATLMDRGRSETLRATLLLLLYDDLVELIDQRSKINGKSR